MIEINTDRLRLRRFEQSDLNIYAEIMGQYNVGKWFPKGEGYTRYEAEKSLNYILEHWSKYGFGIWAVVDKVARSLVGRCGLNMIAETSEVEIDFAISEKRWGRGYGTEAAKAALAYGFLVLSLDRIIALTKPQNTASRRVIEKIGMQYIRNAQYWGIDCAYYQISRKEYIRMIALSAEEQRSSEPLRLLPNIAPPSQIAAGKNASRGCCSLTLLWMFEFSLTEFSVSHPFIHLP